MNITISYLKELRKRKGMTQRELAKKTGYSQAHIAKIEGGKTDPRLSTINKILSVLAQEKKCGDIMVRNIICAGPSETIDKVGKDMWKKGISQMPVFEKNRLIGMITERAIISENNKKKKVCEIMSPPPPVFDKSTPISNVKEFLMNNQAILVSDRGKIVGIITRSDLLRTV